MKSEGRPFGIQEVERKGADVWESTPRIGSLLEGAWWEMKLEAQAEGVDFFPGSDREVVYVQQQESPEWVHVKKVIHHSVDSRLGLRLETEACYS